MTAPAQIAFTDCGKLAGVRAHGRVVWLPPDFVTEIQRTVAQPTIDELARQGIPFVGLLYCGLIMTAEGIKVIEFNARFGDPETQVVLARLTSPLAPLLLAAATGDLGTVDAPKFSKNVAITVVLASEGYPEDPQTGREVLGLDKVASLKNITVAHAGTGWDGHHLLATGGRVLSVIGTGKDFSVARERVYKALEKIELEGSHYRNDIALSVTS
jgi:phosphoribosylamine--glycine ligase